MALRRFGSPSGQVCSRRIEKCHAPIGVCRDDRITDALESDSQPFLLLMASFFDLAPLHDEGRLIRSDGEQQAILLGRKIRGGGACDQDSMVLCDAKPNDCGAQSTFARRVRDGGHRLHGRIQNQGGQCRSRRFLEVPLAVPAPQDLDRPIPSISVQAHIDEVKRERVHENVAQAFRKSVVAQPAPDGGQRRKRH